MEATADYYPDPDYDSYHFELFYHTACRYQADGPPPIDLELPQDYVPDYHWLRNLGRDIVRRLLPQSAQKPFISHREEVVAQMSADVADVVETIDNVLDMIPLLAPSSFSGESDDRHHWRIKILEAQCIVEEVTVDLKGFDDEKARRYVSELACAVKELEQCIKQLEQAVKPRPGQRVARVFSLFSKKPLFDD